MKKLLPVLLGVLFLISCNHYESEVPIRSAEHSKIDKDLLGKWILSSEKKGTTTSGHLEVFPFNEKEYLVQLKEHVDSSEFIQSIINIRMFSSEVENNTYLNLQFIGSDSDKTFMIYKFKPISGNRYKLFFLSKDLFPLEFKNSEGFKSYIETHQKEFDKAFETEGILHRKTTSR